MGTIFLFELMGTKRTHGLFIIIKTDNNTKEDQLVKETKKPSLLIALIPVVFLVVTLISTLQFFGGSPHIPLFTSAIFAALIAMKFLNYKWEVIEEGIVETIKMSMSAVIILMIIGMVIGTWILSGIVPAMILYGLKFLSPGFFLVAALLMCSIVSLATGSSWTTAGTIGIALMGVGTGLGVPAPMTAGAIISGAYFGDKMSPLSDTTNLAPAMAGSNLFDHIRHMIYTTGPSYIISIILFGILGMRYSGNNIDGASISTMIDGISNQFTISPILLIAPIIVIVMVVLRVPAIPGLFGGAVIGGIFASVFQGAGMSAIIAAAYDGYSSATAIESIDSLLSRGGMSSMMGTISLILCAMIFGGVMEKTGMLGSIANGILKLAKSTGSLVAVTIFTCIFMNMIAGDQYLAIVIPGRMYKTAYDERRLAPKNLSRVLEDSATLTSPLIFWNTCGAFMIATLGIMPWTYIPFCFLNILNPIISMIYGFTGYSMEKVEIQPKTEAA